MKEQGSEVTRLLRRIEEEYEAAQRALTGYAITAPHEYITARMEGMQHCHEELQVLVGKDEAIMLLAETLEAAK